jgi:serine/threonine protein phosphatase 1
MTYCISDRHGCYDEFMALLKKIDFSDDDVLYVLGDAIDRGPDSVKCLRYIMNATNIHMLMGNHEQMMIDALTNDDTRYMEQWFMNGGDETLKEFIHLPKDEQLKIVEFVMNLPYLGQVKIGEQNYVLVHAGLNVVDATVQGHASTASIIPQQELGELVWIREKFIRNKALPKSITVFGHTPMLNKKYPSKVWRDERYNDKIGIDGGCVYGGSLLALRLDDMAEFAVSAK